VRIGQRDSDHIILEILRRQYPESNDFWDGNWLVAHVEIRGGGVRGRFETEIRTEEIAEFLAALARLERTPDATAGLKPIEPTISIEIARDKGEGYVARCEAGRASASPRPPSFSIRFGSEELPRLVRELDEIMREYPVVGKKR